MPPIARLVPAAVAVVLLATGCAGGSAEPPATAKAPASTPAASPSAPAPPSTPAARQPHILVFTATGTARITSLTYTLDGESTKVGVRKLPWRLSVDVPSDGLRHEWGVVIEHGKGDVDVRAIFNGNVVGTARGSTSGVGTASTGGSVLG
ncbi:hypothetical protein RB614_26910 [Phytohabitans sp. ZYX-F-186]|uniref:Uncharacterized protein n=1 Tax=Phytohabitans maris TaxID=3071409 RepID=A0ABU0ZM99_9ACTN|nr:hypothetical protein [Phytohabitans sp. ZYX-F-186]MDQ7908161.1 hypothetical protein [Phytohabitans sp. ZYX-F-186]